MSSKIQDQLCYLVNCFYRNSPGDNKTTEATGTKGRFEPLWIPSGTDPACIPTKWWLCPEYLPVRRQQHDCGWSQPVCRGCSEKVSGSWKGCSKSRGQWLRHCDNETFSDKQNHAAWLYRKPMIPLRISVYTIHTPISIICVSLF